MIDEFLKVAASYGIWAAMFMALLIYLLADGRRRESKYQQTVEKLADRLAVVHEIKEDINELKRWAFSARRRGKNEKKDSQKELLDKSCSRSDATASACGCES